MRKISTMLLAGILVYGTPVLAREGGGGQHGHQSGNHNGASYSDQHGNPGAASGHMDERGVENSNAQWSSGATKGQERSELRNNDGQGHGKDNGYKGHKGHKGDKSHK